MVVIYDIECLPYFFSYTAMCNKTENVFQFEISNRKNDWDALKRHLKSLKGMVGYNNLAYDSWIIDYILSRPYATYSDIYKKSEELISNRDSDFSRENTKSKIPQLDLYLIHGFNTKVKATSLKWCEFGMNFHNVEDVDFNSLLHPLCNEEADKVLGYNKNDVLATYELYKKSNSEIELRKKLSADYNRNWMNLSDQKLAREVLLELISQNMNTPKEDIKKLRTHTSRINVKDIIFPFIEFKTEDLKKVLHLYQNQVITETNKFEYTTKICGIETTYALGGIHGCIDKGVYKSDDEWIIVDSDVEGFYNAIIVKNELSPAHIPKEVFCPLYKSFGIERKKYPKGHVLNAAYKLMGNCVYGCLNDEYTFLYDNVQAVKICVNGQLMLSMLIEELNTIEDIQFLQYNTDGITYRIRRRDYDRAMQISKLWEEKTMMTLEHNHYEIMVIQNVNNYLSKDEKGKIKYKGLFEYKNMPLNKNGSNKIIAIALENYYLNNVPVSTTIRNHDNISDFLRGIKAKSNSSFVAYYNNGKIEKLQKVNRYFVCTNKAKDKCRIVKKYDDGRTALMEATTTYQKVVNRLSTDYNYLEEINYNFYEKEANKWINFIDKKLNLFDE